MHNIYGMLLACSFALSRRQAIRRNSKENANAHGLEIEEKIRRRYHQPKGVEQFGIEPVPTELKTVRWLDIFAIIFGFALNPGSILVGGLAVVSGLSFLGAVGAITGGVLLATIAYTIMATVGVDFGLPGQVSTRMAYGVRGAKWVPSFLRTHRLDLLVRLSDRGRVAGGRRDPRPLDRDPAFAGRGQPHLRRAAGGGRDHRLRFAEAPVAHWRCRSRS